MGIDLRAIIVDDEPLGRRAIRQELDRHAEVNVVAECASGTEAINAIAEFRPDVVFLDIQMPGGNGFDVVEAIGGAARPVVIFVTAYNEHAVRAFDVHAVDYLLKPIDGARFDEALSRARARLGNTGNDDVATRVLAAARELAARPGGSGRGKRISVRDAGNVIFFWAGEIDWIGAEGNYVRVHAGRRSVLARDTLQKMIETLKDSRFVRVHRSTVVNGDAVSRIEHAGKGLYVLVLRDGSRVESSYHYRDEVMRLIEGT